MNMLDVFYRISLLSIISTLLIGCSSNNSSITSNENRNNTLNVLSTNLLSIDTMVNISQVYTSTNSPQQTNFTIQPKQIDFTSKQAGDIVGSVYVDKSLSAELNMENIIFVIDSGAVKNNVEISVVEINKTNTADIPDNMENITQGHKCYRMLPDGQKFEKDITIAIKYDSTQLPYGYTEEDIFTFFYNEEIGLWQQVERDSIDREKQLVYSRTNHFTDYINGILKTPESSDAMAYTPTSIKDLKAADPMNGITLMAPPEANNKGTANLTYPLNIPAGRRGMQPNLNISYNSAGGSGWLGLGWSLNISEITVETRWGVPLYDQNKETETYLLDGETLVGSYYDENNQFRLKKPVYRRDYENRSNCDSIFYRRVEGSFQRIIRHGNNPKNYWWEVINKDGTKYVYMTSLTDINGNIAKWYLTQTEDTYGNIVSYEYATKYPQGILTSDSFSYVGKQLVPSTITYTGNKNTSESGQYNLTFIYADKKDKTTSLCYGLEEINYYLLDKIQVKYKAEQIKEYYFGYKIGDFGKSLLSCVIEVFEDSAKYQKYKAQNLHEDTNILLANIYERSEIQPISTANVYLHLKHNFDYYQMNSNKIFGTPHTFSNVSNINSGNINSGTLHKTLLPFKESTNFGGTKSSNWHVSGGINFGLFHRIWLKDLSVGGHYSYINDKSEGLMMLVDVNGDGYPDKLYKKNGFLRCRLQMPGTDQFGSMRTISGVKNFQKSHGSTHCWGFEASAVSIGAGGSWNDSRNSTTTYVSDVNGDGLIDIVDNGKVYLNTGGLVFSDITENSTISIGGSCDDDTISFSGTVDTTLFDNGIKIIEYVHCDTIIKEVKQENDSVTLIKEISNCTTYYDTIEYNYPKRYEPNVDLVRMWKAPYSGNIRLHWTAKLTDSLNDQRLATRANDGVWISTHKKKDTILIASDTILPYGQSIRDTTIAINEGEVLYFRINSLNKRLYDKVEWNPNIDYVSATLRDGRHITSGAELNSRDVNRDYVYKFNYADDFMLNGKNEIAAGSDSSNTFFNKYTIETNIKGTTPLSQDIQYVIYKRDTNTNSTESIVKIKTFTKGTIPNYVDTFETGAILSSKVLLFTLKTKTAGQIKWSDLDATVKVSLFYSTDSVVNKRINDTTAENSYVYYPVIEKQKTYDYLVLPSAKITGFSYIDRLKVNIQTTDNSSINTILVMTIKDSNGLIGNALVPINNNIGSISYQLSNLDPNKIFYIDYYTSSVSLSEKINRITTRINTSQTEYFSGLYGKYSEDNDKHFGTLYRGWGQFGYKDTSSTHFIKEELLNIPAYYSDENFITSSIPDEENINVIDTNTIDAESCPESLINGYYNPLSESFFEMTADGLNCRWKSYGDIVTATRTIMSNDNTSPTNTYEDEEGGDSLQVDFTQSPLPVVFQDQSIKAVNKYNLNKGFGYTIDKYSSNNGTNSLLGDYIDMNGDKYPDIVSSKNIQYSKAQGGLGNNKSGFPENELTKSKTSTHGWTFGGTFLRVEKVLSNNPKNAGSYVVAPQSSPLSFGTTAGEDYTSHTIVDINGDGLPDIVFTNGDIKYNMGYKFTEKRSMAGILGLNTSYSSVVSSNPSFNVLNTSISGGLGRTQTNNRNTHVLIDINGDGLPDIIVGDSIFINKGNNSYESFFDSSLNVITSKTTTYNANISGTLDYPFVIVFVPVKVGGSLGGGFSKTLTTDNAEFIDMNNDGYLDYVYISDNSIKVKYSQIGKANLLKEVSNFAGAKYEIGYTLSKNSSTDCPQRFWNMTDLKIFDGYDGDEEDTLYKRFEYGNRLYDRYEREEYGYNTIVTHEYISKDDYYDRLVYRSNTQVYKNNNYYNQNIKVKDYTTDSIGNKYVENIYYYKDADILDGSYINGGTPAWCRGDVYPALWKEQALFYDSSNTVRIKTEQEYTYTKYGNVNTFTDKGIIYPNTTNGTYNYTAHLSYGLNESQYIVNNVDDFTINGYRHRTADYTPEGSLQNLYIDNENGVISSYHYDYDVYGNVIHIITSASALNDSDNFYEIDYQYDTEIHALPIETKNKQQYTSSVEYDYKWQKPTKTTSINNGIMEYAYDSKGRTSMIRAPKEYISGAKYTILYEYWDKNKYNFSEYELSVGYRTITDPIEIRNRKNQEILAGRKSCFWARTKNYDEFNADNDIETIVFSDGLGRVIQVKKEMDVSSTEKRVVGGNMDFDCLGRTVKEYFPIVEDLTIADSHININYTAEYYTHKDYDILNRITKITYADGSSVSNEYVFGVDFNNATRFLTKTRDQNGHIIKVYTDNRDLKTETVDAIGRKTKFKYDDIGQLLQTIDPDTNSTEYYYDMAGYLVKRIHPSSGTTTWQYDKAGNVIQQTLNSGESIRYLYNYNQLMEVRYSHRFWNDVYYQYGPAGSGNQTGRLVQQQDATGVQDFRYDAMGNVVGNRHTYVIPNNPEVFTLTTLWEYDSWGRIRNIIYPDREKVVYSYDRGGNLLDVSGVKAGQSNRYISRIEYNKYNQRISETKGNGIVTTYAYNPQNNRLTNLKEQSAVTNMIYQDVNYVYDGVGNITSISDNGLHSRTQSFSYDNINRLTNSDGNWDALQYNTELSYSKSGKILSKTMKSTRLNNIASLFQVDYDNNYYYSSYNPYAVKQIVNSSGDIEFHWDTKGNMIHSEDNINHLRRDMCWTEDNRLQAFREYEENNIAAYYNYDANGERNLKFTSPRIRSSQNAAPFAQNPNLVFPTLYASSLITITKRGYTKHYFEEGKRICSKIGGGFAFVDWNTITDKVPELTYGYDEQVEHQRIGIRETFGTCMHADVIIDPHFNLFEMMQYQGIKDLTEYPFYYHSDHLGSATYLTDRIGNVIQTLTYLPYGEDWVDIYNISSSCTTMLGMYSFNGKEKDYESGFHYYGARYYASELSMWLSTDPMSDKYPSLSPYDYCANNPVKLIDPNGEEIWVAKQENGTYKITGGILNKDKGIYVRNNKGTKSKIGETLTKYSFFGEDNKVVIGVVIDPMDNSGKEFLSNMEKSNMTLFEYIMDKKSGRNGANMDFKRLNEPQNLTNELKEKYYNRGMNIGGVAGIKEGNIYGSARDIGNFAAGYMAGSRGLSWTAARAGFDGYESIERKTFRMEHSVTRTAEWLGWKKGFWTKGFKKCLNLK